MNTQANPSADAYIPGVCNINTAEVAYRRKAGYLGTAIFVVLLVILVAAGLNRWLRLVLVLPVMLAAIGFLQAKNHFCVGYAGSGQQNASEGSAKASNIADAEAKKKDKARARQINMQAVGIAIVVTLITLVIPVLNR